MLTGPSLDKGPSDFSPTHTFLVNGLVDLPWKFQVSGIYRVQTGFPFSRFAKVPLDVDGDGQYTDLDIVNGPGRNAFNAPSYQNMDTRVSKLFMIGERVKVRALFEFFNLFNTADTAAVQNAVGQTTPFGKPLQVLPGREGQVGLRIDF